MDTALNFLIYSLGILTISMIGAFLPRIRTLSDRQIHLLVAMSTGIFIGLLFLLLLPEALEACEENGMDTHEVMMFILAGFLLIMAVETWMKHRHMSGCGCECGSDTHSHKITSFSSMIGLSIHAACDGLALASTFLIGDTVALMTTVGMCIHKFVVLFSLSSMMLVTDIPKKQSMKYLLAFGLVTPIAGLVFFALLSGMSDIDGLAGIPMSFAAGTFMYVALCDMLPEAFHRKKQDTMSFALLLVGVVIILAITMLFPHVH